MLEPIPVMEDLEVMDSKSLMPKLIRSGSNLIFISESIIWSMITATTLEYPQKSGIKQCQKLWMKQEDRYFSQSAAGDNKVSGNGEGMLVTPGELLQK